MLESKNLKEESKNLNTSHDLIIQILEVQDLENSFKSDYFIENRNSTQLNRVGMEMDCAGKTPHLVV